jgi:hypothetical protein
MPTYLVAQHGRPAVLARASGHRAARLLSRGVTVLEGLVDEDTGDAGKVLGAGEVAVPPVGVTYRIHHNRDQIVRASVISPTHE